MRLRITNASREEDSRILPLIRFAAKHFNVKGKVHVRFSATRTGKILGGYCTFWGKEKQISVRSTLDPEHRHFPFVNGTLRYFRSDNIPIDPYTLNNPDEVIVHVAAHEFAHLMKRGQKFRKSRIEVFCENKATEVLKAFRSPDGQAWIANQRNVKVEEPAADETPNERGSRIAKKLAAIEVKLKRWNTKLKRAQMAIKKLNRQKKYQERQAKVCA